MLVRFKNKNEFFSSLSKFYSAISTGSQARPENYNGAFTDGYKKAPYVIDFLNRKNVNFERLAYISIGGADGAEVVHVLQHTKIKYGILLEYSTEFCKKAQALSRRLLKNKTLYIESGDVYSNISKVRDIIKEINDQIDGIIITGFSVFHELAYRSVHSDYDFRTLIINLTEGLSEVYFYCKEPCNFHEWNGRVKISIPQWFKSKELKRFAEIVQLKLGKENTKEFNEPITQLPDGVEMNAELATEVIKKVVYFLHDKSVPKLIYELGESHAKFNSVEFTKSIKSIFDTGSSEEYDSYVKLRYDTSETFSKLFDEADIRVKSIGDKFLDEIIPMGFFRVEAYYRHKKRKRSFTFPPIIKDNIGPSVIDLFYEHISHKKYEHAFGMLSPFFKTARWNDDLGYFIDGYSNILELTLVNHFVIEESSYESKSIVHIRKRVFAYKPNPVKNLNDILKVKIKYLNFDKLKENFDSTLKTLIDMGGYENKLMDIEVFRLIHPNYIDDLRWISGIKSSAMENCFEREELLINETNIIYCQNINDYWYINRILPVNYNGTYSI